MIILLKCVLGFVGLFGLVLALELLTDLVKDEIRKHKIIKSFKDAGLWQ